MRVADRLSLRWYLGYGLTESLPDHSSLTRLRERYGVAVFQRVFEAIVEPYLETLEEADAQWFLGCRVWRRAGAVQMRERWA
jgi:hypothetical protein